MALRRLRRHRLSTRPLEMHGGRDRRGSNHRPSSSRAWPPDQKHLPADQCVRVERIAVQVNLDRVAEGVLEQDIAAALLPRTEIPPHYQRRPRHR